MRATVITLISAIALGVVAALGVFVYTSGADARAMAEQQEQWRKVPRQAHRPQNARRQLHPLVNGQWRQHRTEALPLARLQPHPLGRRRAKQPTASAPEQ